MKIALINVMNKSKNFAMNKDLNGGFGTADDYGYSFTSKILRFIKKNSIKLPVIEIAYLQEIFKEKGYEVSYFEGKLPETYFDLILIYGTIVDYKNENKVCQVLKKTFPKSKIGFFGPFVKIKPDLFKSGDFNICGESEYFFIYKFKSENQLQGHITVSEKIDLDDLPLPSFDNFPINSYSYFPAIKQKPFLVLQASRGCPYSCRFYCTYGEYQGSKVRLRSVKKIVKDIVYLQKKYNIKGIQFRDPTFGLIPNFIEDFCKELKETYVNIKWGMETRLDLLNEEKIKKMFEVGLRNINVGIETNDINIAKKNKRLLIQKNHQENIIKFCEKIGVKISAFYILGYEGDTEETVKNTINYAKKLNTLIARFSVSTPYPGTGFFNQLEKENRILTYDFEKYTQFNLVYRHNNFSPKQVQKLLDKAYRNYYFRISYLFKFLKWQIREFWL